MKLTLLITALMSLPFFGSEGSIHDYFVSITELAYNSEKNQFEMSVQLEAHDLERAIEMEGNTELLLGSGSEHPEADKFIEKYIKRRLKITVDGQSIPLNMIGKVVGNDERLFCFIEAPYKGDINEMEVQCRFLTDIFSDQQNIIHTEINGVKKSQTLTREKYKVEFSY